MEDLKLCEVHYLQGRHRQNKEKVPESLKLQRKSSNKNNNVEIRANMARLMEKRKRKSPDALVAGDDAPSRTKALKKRGESQLELIRMVLEKEIQKNKKNKKKKKKKKCKEKKRNKKEEDELHYSEGELRRELPNGVMEIAPASSTPNVASHCDDVKVGFDHKSLTPRYFRSKNVERVPVGNLQVGFYDFHCLYITCSNVFLMIQMFVLRLCHMDGT